MDEQIKNITIYKQPYKSDRLDAYVNCILSGDFSKNLAGKIRKFICDEINCAKTADEPEQITKVAEGSSSVCYRSDSNEQCKYIYKLFDPQGIRTDTENGFVWLSDDASNEECASFLRRFARFIKQIETIQSIVKYGNDEEHNLLVKLQLSLTSLGLVWGVNVLYGETLQQIFNDNPILSTQQDVYDRMLLVLNLAHEIQFLHRHLIFHGDIKPDNFFKVSFKQGHYDVCNIDYDTCLAIDQRKEGHPQHLLASTASFYSSTILKNLVKSETATFDDWAVLDVKALAKVLMCALGFNIEALSKEEKNSLSTDELGDWNELFTKSNAFQNLFMALGAKDKLSSLYIVNKLTKFLKNCSYNAKPSQKIITIDHFIDELANIANLIGKMFEICSSTQLADDIIKCRGLDELQRKQVQQEYFLNGIVKREFTIDDEVEKILAECFDITNRDSDVNPIDKRLLPSIFTQSKSHKGGKKIYAYNVKSPLEQLLSDTDKNLFLYADGGTGKSTTMYTFWLDYLSGKHAIPCIYVDMKLLNKRDTSEAISRYVSDKYGIKLQNITDKTKIILLLDGANEAEYTLRTCEKTPDSGETDYKECCLVRECNNLISFGYKLVITNRTHTFQITNSKEISEESAFNLQFMEYCKLSELTDEQLSNVVPNVDTSSTLYRLLKNNMMLYVYRNLQKFDIHIDSNQINAGQLLKLYFDICFRVKYIKNSLKETKSELELREIISSNAIDIYQNEEIKTENNRYDDICRYLSDYAFEGDFNFVTIQQRIGIKPTEHLSILSCEGGIRYVWTNEMYKQFFQASKVMRVCRDIEKGKSYSYEELEKLYDFGSNMYLVYHLAGELGCFNQEQVDTISTNMLKFAPDHTDFVIELALLAGLDLPEGITTIPENCFSYCSLLKKLDLKRSIKKIERGAFYECTSLETLRIKSVDKIEGGAFCNCDNLKNIAIENAGQVGFMWAFTNCVSLEEVCLHGKDLHIMGSIFGGANIKKISISSAYDLRNIDSDARNSIKHIAFTNDVDYVSSIRELCPNVESVICEGEVGVGDDAFVDCEKLQRIQFEGYVKFVGKNAFANCPSLEIIDVRSGIGWVSENAFKNCTALSAIEVQSEFIKESAFEGCKSLREVTLTNKYVYICVNAFKDCVSLESVVIKGKVKEVGKSAFENCAKLKEMYFTTSHFCVIKRFAFKNCKSLQIVRIEGRLDTLKENVFENCESLREVYLPKIFGSVKKNIFYGCNNLTDIYCRSGKIGRWFNVLYFTWSLKWLNGCSATVHWKYKITK